MDQISAKILEVLSPELGPHTAGQALRVACKKAKIDPEAVTSQDLPAITEHIERMCRTLLGRKRSTVLVQRISQAATRTAILPEAGS